MRAPKERQAIQQVAERLSELLGADSTEADVRWESGESSVDAVVEVGGTTFAIEFKASSETARIAAAAEQVRAAASSLGKETVPLVAVPFMGPAGRRRCEKAEVAWLDLSGNARIIAKGIRVLIGGETNRYKQRGRPSSPFAPKSSRIARWLLMHPRQAMTQRGIAQATGMDEGFTSRIVSKLRDDGLVVREQDGTIRPRDPDLLLDAWREDYDFSTHQILRGHVAARSGEELLRRFASGLREQKVRHAVTGLAAAWLLTKFAGFRLVTTYVSEPPAPKVLERLGFRKEERGANLWFVIPKDEGVFHGADEHDGVACVHPIQAYLDLKDQPERAKEAADHLRVGLLTWRTDD